MIGRAVKSQTGYPQPPSRLRRALCALGLHRRPLGLPALGEHALCGAHCHATWEAAYDGIEPHWRRVS